MNELRTALIPQQRYCERLLRPTERTQNTSNSQTLHAVSWKSLPSTELRISSGLLPLFRAPQCNANYAQELPVEITKLFFHCNSRIEFRPCMSVHVVLLITCAVRTREHLRLPQPVASTQCKLCTHCSHFACLLWTVSPLRCQFSPSRSHRTRSLQTCIRYGLGFDRKKRNHWRLTQVVEPSK